MNKNHRLFVKFTNDTTQCDRVFVQKRKKNNLTNMKHETLKCHLTFVTRDDDILVLTNFFVEILFSEISRYFDPNENQLSKCLNVFL